MTSGRVLYRDCLAPSQIIPKPAPTLILPIYDEQIPEVPRLSHFQPYRLIGLESGNGWDIVQ
ncbi:MAG: hypothetical protein F6K41_26485 [Symploca sp. SIO3E6]|nr:hypothetical protein [Caldora sp. SIO3E6]